MSARWSQARTTEVQTALSGGGLVLSLVLFLALWMYAGHLPGLRGGVVALHVRSSPSAAPLLLSSLPPPLLFSCPLAFFHVPETLLIVVRPET